MTTQDRYPRGYSPERQSEVSQALNRVQFRASRASLLDRESGMREVSFARQAIMRSRIPVEHLRGLEGVHMTSPSVSQDSYAHYSFGRHLNDGRIDPEASLHVRDPIDSRSNVVVLRSSKDNHQGPNDVSRSMVHELGHHVQNLPRLDKGVPYRARSSFRGYVRDEADAENYADTYHVDDRRFPPADTRSGYDLTLIDHANRALVSGTYAHRFANEYRKHRQLNLSQFMPPKPPSRPKKGTPHPGQLSLFDQEPEQLRLF